MYGLYNKIFKNKYLKNIIFSNIREYNKEQRYIRYNYYDFPFELILKTKNQQLLIEKLNDYKFYFIENQNNINVMDTFKYFINFNESCLEQLYIWNELPFELFEMVFKIFGNEIYEINNTFQINNRGRNYYIANQFQIFGKLFYKHLIKSCNFDKFKFLINNDHLNIKKIDLCSLKLLFQEITLTDSVSKEEKDNEINKRKEMFEFIFNEIDIPFNHLTEYLNSLIASKNLSEIYGQFIIDHFPKQLEISQEKPLERCMLSIFEHQNLFIFKGILNKYKYIEQKIDILQSPAELVTIFGIKIEKCVIKAMKIPTICLFESFNVEITKTLWEDLKFSSIALFTLRSLVTINDPNVALYFNGKLKGDISLKKISLMCDYRLRKMGMRDQVRFETTYNTKFDNNYLNNNVSKEMIQDLPIGLYIQNELLDCIIKKGCIETFKEYFKKFPKHYNIEHVKNISLLMRDTEFFDFILDIIKFGQPPEMNHNLPYHQSVLKALLEFSIENDIGKLFDSVSYRLTSFLSNNPNQGKSFIINISDWVVSNPTLARRWLNNSTFKFYYQEIVSEKVDQILSEPNFIITPNSMIESKFIIGELLNTDFQIKAPQTTKLQSRIIRFAIRNEIALTNSHTLSYGFSKINRIKSLYFKIFCSFYRYYDSLEAERGKGFILYKIIIKLLKCNILSLENFDSKLFSKIPHLEEDIKNFISKINNNENNQNIITFTDSFKNLNFKI
ncbi:hypothetical protein ACTFIY_006344 [Dictyostelium cf. discoideum]